MLTEKQRQFVRTFGLTHIVRIEKEGYVSEAVEIESKATWSLLVNVIWIHPIGWLIGGIVDTSTGAVYKLTPAAITVSLTPENQEPAVPEPNDRKCVSGGAASGPRGGGFIGRGRASRLHSCSS